MTGTAKEPTQSASERFNEVCTVRIELRNSEPLIWRQLEVPTSVTLKLLHDIVGIVMNWQDYHLWAFTIGGRRYNMPSEEDYRDMPLFDGANIHLRDVLRRGAIERDYTYDFGDNWKLRLLATDIRLGEAAVSYPRYIGRERNGPPEDCGGIHGFYRKLEARRGGRPGRTDLPWAITHDILQCARAAGPELRHSIRLV